MFDKIPPESNEGKTPEQEAADSADADSPAAISAATGLPPVSALYTWEQFAPIATPHSPAPAPGVEAGVSLVIRREELRLDVDGRYPQMAASGSIRIRLGTPIYWIAKLAASGLNSWAGAIWFKDGNAASFPYTNVAIKVTRSIFARQQKATVTYSGGGAANRTVTYDYKSPYFRGVNFEFDFAEGIMPLTSINTGAHPNRPASLPVESLSLKKVYKRAGFNVTTSAGGSVPLAGAGADALWNDNEMHDAMQGYWSRFAAKAQWAFWTFFAARHEMGSSLGGIMFDDIGPQHRQGTAVFVNSFISVAPPGDPNPAAWVRRMIFWTACHEMGHTFNLAHSWQKSLIFGGHGPWIPLADEPEVRSFMNYPFRVAGGTTAFFADFEYRFSDGELLFMRHAPERFVEHGDALWFDHHGFQEANLSPEPALKLELRVNRERADFEFLEPVVMELKLTNISSEPQIIPDNILSMQDCMTVIIKRKGRPAQQFTPFARYCFQPKKKVLMPKEKIYESFFPAVGAGGWQISEPGYYQIQVALHLGDEDLVSNPLILRVAPPRGYDEEFLAQDFFSEDVGRILTFDGSRYLSGGNDVLNEVAERLSDRKVAIHARVPLGKAFSHDYKLLDVRGHEQPSSAALAGGGIRQSPANPEKAHRELSIALTAQSNLAAQTLGHIDYKYYVDHLSDLLARHGEQAAAADVQDVLYETLAARNVAGSVLQEVRSRRDRAARAAGV